MKITGSLFMGTARDFLERATSITYPHIHEIGEVITDYQVTALKRKDSWWSHADLQGHIAISLFNELQSLRYLQDISVPEEQEKERHFSEQVTRATVNAFTQVVDGMAVRFLDYSYAMCQILGLGPTSPHSIMDEGFANVSDIAFAQLEIAGPGTQLIVCDLNSIINIGDFILKRKSGEFEVIEVKRGKKRRGSRLKRQMRRLEQTSELLNTKKGTIDDIPVEILDLPTRKHYVKELAKIFETDTDFAKVHQINDYQSIVCFDVFKVQSEEQINACTQEIIEQTKKLWKSERLFEISSLIGRQVPGLMPVTVFPLPASTITEILLGQKIYFSTIDFDALIGHIERKGWKVFDLSDKEIVENGKHNLLILIDEHNPNKNVTLPIDILLEISLNLIDLDSILDSLKVQIEKHDEQINYIPNYLEEESLWQ